MKIMDLETRTEEGETAETIYFLKVFPEYILGLIVPVSASVLCLERLLARRLWLPSCLLLHSAVTPPAKLVGLQYSVVLVCSSVERDR